MLKETEAQSPCKCEKCAWEFGGDMFIFNNLYVFITGCQDSVLINSTGNYISYLFSIYRNIHGKELLYFEAFKSLMIM